MGELDIADILPIVCSCEFALCVYYARAVLMRTLRSARLQRAEQVVAHSQSLPQRLLLLLTVFVSSSSMRSSSSSCCCNNSGSSSSSHGMRSISRCSAADLLNAEHRRSGTAAQTLPAGSARQHVSKPRPQQIPGPQRRRVLHRIHAVTLSNFERALFPLSVATISVDESYAQSVAVISNFIAVLIQVVLLPDSISDSGCTGASVVDNDISASNSGSNK